MARSPEGASVKSTDSGALALADALLPWAAAALGPLLLWQGRSVRRRALKLPEAQGPREGEAGTGEVCLRLLIVGDSSAAGVGAATQEQALAGCLARELAAATGLRVRWQLLAQSGDGSAEALRRLEAAQPRPADLMLAVLGVNDAVALRSPARWLADLERLDQLARRKAGVRYTLHTAVPPMQVFPLLPQPLRGLLGWQAARLNRALTRALRGQHGRGLHAMPADWQGSAAGLMADDGFHPGPPGYRLWARELARHLHDSGLAARLR